MLERFRDFSQTTCEGYECLVLIFLFRFPII
jgi:hypothetical protein